MRPLYALRNHDPVVIQRNFEIIELNFKDVAAGVGVGVTLDEALILTPDSATRNTAQPTDPGYSALTLKGAASQTANIFSVKDSSDNVKVAVDANGHLKIGHNSFSTYPLELSINQHAATQAAIINLNTVGSAARAGLVIHSTSGDSFIRMTTGNVWPWVIGPNHSGSGSFTIATGTLLGTTTEQRLIISTSGRVTIPTGDLYVVRSADSGVGPLIAVKNTSSDPDAHAQITIGVQGTGAGDPKLVYELPAGTSWAMGIDNSDDDCLKIVSSTTDLGSSLGFIAKVFIDRDIGGFAIGNTATRTAKGCLFSYNNSDNAECSFRFRNTGSGGMADSAINVLSSSGSSGIRLRNGTVDWAIAQSGESGHDSRLHFVYNGNASESAGLRATSASDVVAIYLTKEGHLGLEQSIILPTSGGTRIGTDPAQLLAFWAATPVDQPDHISDPSGVTTDEDVEARTTIAAILDLLQETGLMAAP